jgi:hypothetical protein
MATARTASASGRVFYDGFESGNFDAGWSDGWSDGPGLIPPAGNKGHDNLVLPVSGNRQMECWYGHAGTDTWFCKYISIDSLYTNEIFIRLWMRLDSDVQSNEGSMAHLLRFYAGGGGATDILTCMIGDGAGSSQIITDALWNGARPTNAPQYYSFSPGVGDHQWHKYELYLNNSTHLYKIWEDDVLKMSLSDPMINFHFGSFIPLHNWGSPKPTDDNTHFYFDEVEVFSDLGAGGAGSMANGDMTQGSSTTAPSAPLNLRVM